MRKNHLFFSFLQCVPVQCFSIQLQHTGLQWTGCYQATAELRPNFTAEWKLNDEITFINSLSIIKLNINSENNYFWSCQVEQSVPFWSPGFIIGCDPRYGLPIWSIVHIKTQKYCILLYWQGWDRQNMWHEHSCSHRITHPVWIRGDLISMLFIVWM